MQHSQACSLRALRYLGLRASDRCRQLNWHNARNKPLAAQQARAYFPFLASKNEQRFCIGQVFAQRFASARMPSSLCDASRMTMPSPTRCGSKRPRSSAYSADGICSGSGSILAPRKLGGDGKRAF